MEKERLTQRQNETFEFIRRYLERNHKPPTLREIGDALGIASTNGVYKLLDTLEKKGWIERSKHEARGIRIPDRSEDPFDTRGQSPSLPIISRTPSDQPERLRERPKGTLSVDDRLLEDAQSPHACLAGHAGDDGMNEAGIRKGDLMLVEEMDWTDLANGTLVAVIIQDRLLPRRFEYADETIHLRPADRHYTEETFPPNDPGCYVVGRLLGLIRTL